MTKKERNNPCIILYKKMNNSNRTLAFSAGVLFSGKTEFFTFFVRQKCKYSEYFRNSAGFL